MGAALRTGPRPRVYTDGTMTGDKVPEFPAGFTAVQVLDDPTPDAIIQIRIVRTGMEIAAGFTNLTREEGKDVLDLLLLIGRKMCSVWKHLDAYHREERLLVEKFSNGDVNHFEFSQVLYEEFDVFAVQIKSTLDHVVKMMRPMIGRSWTIYTFADKGEGVLRALKGNTGRKHKGRVKSMELLLFNPAHREWLEAIIQTRDRVNHGIAGGLKIENFAVLRRPDGTVELPMWSDKQQLGAAMNGIWTKFFSFVEDFIMLSLHFRIPEEKFSIFKEPKPITSPDSPWFIMDAEAAEEMVKKMGFRPIS